MGVERQKVWGGLVLLDIFLGGVGGGSFALGYIMTFLGSSKLLAYFSEFMGVIFVGIGVFSLFVEVGNPKNSTKILYNIRRSWLSRGGLIQPLFIILGITYVFRDKLSFLIIFFPSDIWLVMGLLSFLLSIVVCVYHGMVLNQSKAVSLWASPIIPPLYFITSLIGGAGLITTLILFFENKYLNEITLSLKNISYINLVLIVSLILGLYIVSISEPDEAYKKSISDLKGVIYLVHFISLVSFFVFVFFVIYGYYISYARILLIISGFNLLLISFLLKTYFVKHGYKLPYRI